MFYVEFKVHNQRSNRLRLEKEGEEEELEETLTMGGLH
jgi:hypothetical protein